MPPEEPLWSDARLAELGRKVDALAERVEAARLGPASRGIGFLAVLTLMFIASHMGILRRLLQEVLLKLP